MVKATVSGSFHRHMTPIAEAVQNLQALGVEVLSPSDPRVVDQDGDFLFVASDKLRSRKLVEDRHLEAIRASDFLWVVCPDGYTGASTSGEILAAHVLGKPVYASTAALDITIGDYVTKVASITEAIGRTRMLNRAQYVPHALLAPERLSFVAEQMDDLRFHLTAQRGDGKKEAERRFKSIRAEVGDSFGLSRAN